MTMTRESLSGELDITNSVALAAAAETDERASLESCLVTIENLIAAEQDRQRARALVWGMVAFVVGLVVGAIFGLSTQAG